MKTNGRIRELLAIPCANDIEYGHRVIWPLLDYLGIPAEARRPQFQIENPFGTGRLKLDYLLHHGDLPLVTIEGEPTARQFEVGFRQARNYSRNFKPRQRGCPMQERTVPFLLTAAGNRAEMARAVVRGLNIEYEPIRHEGRPAFLEWEDLLRAAGPLRATALHPQEAVLVADAALQFFRDLYGALEEVPSLRTQDDRKIVLFNHIIDLARAEPESRLRAACVDAGAGTRAVRRVLDTLGWYRQKIASNEFTGAAVARGYRTFLLQPGGRGAHHYFTGESQSRAYRVGRTVRYRNVARYFTPTEIVQQMVRLARPRACERVLDMTCGSGGFLAECLDFVAQAEGAARAEEFLTHRLVGLDDDPFCVSCARELLTFFHPHQAARLQVFLHNCLYQRAPRSGEIAEDRAAERHLQADSYDLVIGNPPGNNEYSGTNRAEVARQWARRFGHVEGGLMDHHCFLRRAVELARPEGGRVCLLVPEGLLARDNRGLPALRTAITDTCELRLVVTLPRVFPNNQARMAVVYLVRAARPSPRRRVVLAELRERWQDRDDAERTTDLFGELEALVSDHLGGGAPAAQP